MTDCRCPCATFGNLDGSPHEKEARHPNPKACEHSEEEPPPVVKWTDAQGHTYVSVPFDDTVPHG